MQNTSPAITPENEALTRQLELLREEFTGLYARHKDMVENESVILTSVYLQKLGYLQLELLQKQTEATRLRMKMQMIQAAINRDEKPEIGAIEAILNDRLEKYYAEIAASAAALDESSKVLQHLISEEDTLKLKEVFRVLCKRLHPDLNPNQPAEDRDLFVKVKAAYDLNALHELQTILLYLDDLAGEKLLLVSLSDKQERIQHLKGNIKALKEKISSLEQSFPFSQKELITDEAWISGRQKEIRSQIMVFEENIGKYSNIISLLCNE
ncbi:MAG TPA: J domain-containing protein [Bacteroidales bacterium]|nr:J domain-containing protein [Bacteroidales bacterium]HRZ47777.1 J domain-containing protein [Bacteroidales bacterium]